MASLSATSMPYLIPAGVKEAPKRAETPTVIPANAGIQLF
jgi:hypothetical protein